MYAYGPSVHAGEAIYTDPTIVIAEQGGTRAHVIAKPVEQSDWFAAALAAQDATRQAWMDRIDEDPILANAVAESRY